MTIRVRNLEVKIDKFTLGELNFELENGYIYALVGNNGSGKTTLLHTLLGTEDIERGEIEFDNLKFPKDQEEMKKKYAYVPDEIFFTAKVEKVVDALEVLDSRFSAKKCYELLEKFEVDLKTNVNKLSTGNKKKLIFSIGMALESDILVLDEPTANVDICGKKIMLDLIREYLTENKIVIFSTHIPSEVTQLADYILVMDKGKLILKEDIVSLEQNNLDNMGNIRKIDDIILDLLK